MDVSKERSHKRNRLHVVKQTNKQKTIRKERKKRKKYFGAHIQTVAKEKFALM